MRDELVSSESRNTSRMAGDSVPEAISEGEQFVQRVVHGGRLGDEEVEESGGVDGEEAFGGGVEGAEVQLVVVALVAACARPEAVGELRSQWRS